MSLLNLSPGIQLADNVAARNVALSDARFRLVSDEEDEARPSLEAMTQAQLTAELRRLDETRPSLVGPIVMLVVGAALAVPGYIVINILSPTLLTLGTNATMNGTAVLLAYLGFIGAGVLCIVGIVLVIIGTVKLIRRILAKKGHSEEVLAVQQRLDTINAQPPAVPEAPPPLPPPPPLAPPSASLVIPLRTVMTF